jgi:predicted enzyme related to lactoylglutathione lyase
MDLPQAPLGNGQHPVTLVVISANHLTESSAFYAKVFGWQMMKMSAELTAAQVPAGPMIALRANVPDGFPGVVPYIGVKDVDAMLQRVVSASGTVERASWTMPMLGTMARFADASGTIYGLTTFAPPTGSPHVPMPFGTNPKPPANSICSLEMYAKADASPPLFSEMFGWGTVPTMPAFVAFDAGAGVGGVFQSHTPALPAVAYIYVVDVAATLLAIDAAGGKRQGDAMSMPGMGTFGYFSDPSTTTMALIGP